MSSKALNPLTPTEFEELKHLVINASLTDAQITDLALLLMEKLEQNKG